MDIITVEELGKKYSQNWVVDKISFKVKQGEIFAFLGPNGAGKTTTIRMLTTIILPSFGTAKIDGYDIREHPLQVRRRIAVIPQGGGLNPFFTVYEDIRVYLLLCGWKMAKARCKAIEVIKTFDLASHINKRGNQLSGGLRRRVQVARVLATEAPIIFVDEPTIGLDPASRRQTWQFIKEACDNGRTIFLTTQSMDEAEHLADRVCFLYRGKIVDLDTPASLRRFHGQGHTRLRFENSGKITKSILSKVFDNLGIKEWRLQSAEEIELDIHNLEESLPKILPELSRRGIKLISVDPLGPSLEEVYLEIMKEGK